MDKLEFISKSNLEHNRLSQLAVPYEDIESRLIEIRDEFYGQFVTEVIKTRITELLDFNMLINSHIINPRSNFTDCVTYQTWKTLDLLDDSDWYDMKSLGCVGNDAEEISVIQAAIRQMIKEHEDG